jgi:hypothetical protein
MISQSHVSTKSEEELGLYFDPQTKLLGAYEVIDTESILGDVPAQYILSDYKTVDGLMLPLHIAIRKGGKDYSDVQFTAIAVNDPAADQVFAIPESAEEEAAKAAATDEYSPLKIVKVGNGVYQAAGYSHNSLIVEFPQWLALVDSPYTETQAKALFRAIQQQFPTKPVKYVAVSPHHYDHIGGLRAAAAMGSTILVEKRHEPVVRSLLMRATHIRRTNSTSTATASRRNRWGNSRCLKERRLSAKAVNPWNCTLFPYRSTPTRWCLHTLQARGCFFDLTCIHRPRQQTADRPHNTCCKPSRNSLSRSIRWSEATVA